MPIAFDPHGPLMTKPIDYDGVQSQQNLGFRDPMTLALLGASAGFLDPNGGMMAGFQGAMHGMNMGDQMQQRGMQQQMLAKKLQRQIETENYMKTLAQKHAGNPMGMAKEMMSSGIPEVMQQAATIAKGMGTKYLQSQDASGNAVHAIGNNFGDITNTDARVPTKLMQTNEGNQITFRNPFTGEARGGVGVGMAPGEAARLSQAERQFGMSHGLAQQNSALNQYKTMMEMNPDFLAQKAGAIEGAKFGAKNQAQAQIDLPQVVQQGDQTIKLVDDLLKHPGFNISVGAKSPVGKVASFVPGTDAASFDVASKQMLGKQFLEAFNSLKGAGQITEIEGQKATEAMSRMKTSNSQEEYIKAAHEFQDTIRMGINRAKQKAGVTQSDGWGDVR
jgi:hypothetical protein